MGGDHLNWCPVIYIPVYSIRVLNYVSSGKQFLEYHVKQVPADEVNTQLIFPSKPESDCGFSPAPVPGTGSSFLQCCLSPLVEIADCAGYWELQQDKRHSVINGQPKKKRQRNEEECVYYSAQEYPVASQTAWQMRHYHWWLIVLMCDPEATDITGVSLISPSIPVSPHAASVQVVLPAAADPATDHTAGPFPKCYTRKSIPSFMLTFDLRCWLNQSWGILLVIVSYFSSHIWFFLSSLM